MHVGISSEDRKGPRPLVIAQLGQSLDGRIALPSGESKYISGSHALDHVHRLRAQVDGVLVGVGTVVADDPLLTVRRVQGQSPARIVIDPNGRMAPDARCLVEDGARRIVIRRAGASGALPPGVERIDLDDAAALEPSAILAALAARGIARILVEGGTRTLSTFLDAGAIDLFHVIVSPVILGSGRAGLDLAPIASLAAARRPFTRVHVFPDGDVLFACDLRRGAGAKQGEEVLNDDAEPNAADGGDALCPAG